VCCLADELAGGVVERNCLVEEFLVAGSRAGYTVIPPATSTTTRPSPRVASRVLPLTTADSGSLRRSRRLAGAGGSSPTKRSCGFSVVISEREIAACAILIALFLRFMQVGGIAQVRGPRAGERDRTADLPLTRRSALAWEPRTRNVYQPRHLYKGMSGACGTTLAAMPPCTGERHSVRVIGVLGAFQTRTCVGFVLLSARCRYLICPVYPGERRDLDRSQSHEALGRARQRRCGPRTQIATNSRHSAGHAGYLRTWDRRIASPRPGGSGEFGRVLTWGSEHARWPSNPAELQLELQLHKEPPTTAPL
jgi:hypothetical protein